MKLLLVHRYIRPDTPGYAHMLYIMGQHFAKQGHEVTIFSAQPSYNDAYDGPSLPKVQQVDGMTVIRTPLFKETKKNALMRSLNFLRFSMALFCHAVFRRQAYDLMTVTTFPPAIMGFLARMIGCFRKTKYVYHCMDLYPEVAETSGVIKRKFGQAGDAMRLERKVLLLYAEVARFNLLLQGIICVLLSLACAG